MSFAERLDHCVERSGSQLCAGIDPVAATAAEAERLALQLLEGSLEHVAAVKPNLAFFEQYGSTGYALLERLRSRVPADRVYLLDGKRGDIGSTGEAYARALFDVLGADAVTLNPLLGRDSVAPFLGRSDRGVFLVARSSNPGAADLLDAPLAGGGPLHRRIVELGLSWDPGGAVGFVAGATNPEAIAAIRSLAPEAPLLLPGVGAQGGSLEESVRAAASGGSRRFLVAVSRGIAAAADGPGRAALELRRRITQALEAAAPA